MYRNTDTISLLPLPEQQSQDPLVITQRLQLYLPLMTIYKIEIQVSQTLDLSKSSRQKQERKC